MLKNSTQNSNFLTHCWKCMTGSIIFIKLWIKLLIWLDVERGTSHTQSIQNILIIFAELLIRVLKICPTLAFIENYWCMPKITLQSLNKVCMLDCFDILMSVKYWDLWIDPTVVSKLSSRLIVLFLMGVYRHAQRVWSNRFSIPPEWQAVFASIFVWLCK